MRKPRVFVDAGVLFAGAASPSEHGASLLILRLGELTLIEAVTSEQVLTEAERNLKAKLPEALPLFRLLVERALTVIPSPAAEDVAIHEGRAHPKDLAHFGGRFAGSLLLVGHLQCAPLSTRPSRGPSRAAWGIHSPRTGSIGISTILRIMSGLIEISAASPFILKNACKEERVFFKIQQKRQKPRIFSRRHKEYRKIFDLLQRILRILHGSE